MAVRVQIGEASTDGAVAENQVLVRYYDQITLDQTVVLRPKSAELAEKTALLCEQACANNNILYKLGGSASLYRAAVKSDFNFSETAITTKCYADCSGFASIIAKGAGARISISESSIPNCGNMRENFKNSNDYEILTDQYHLDGCDYLRRGDIAVREQPNASGYRHALIVLSNGEFAPAYSLGVYFKTELAIDKVTSKKAIVSGRLIKTENSDEVEITSDDLKQFDLSKCLYTATLLSNTESHIVYGYTKVSKNTFNFEINNLKPDSVYLLELTTDEDICASRLLFTTPPEYPDPINDLKVIFSNDVLKNKEIKVTFNIPDNWENLSNNKGYRVFLIVNNKIVASKDDIIKSSKSKVSSVFNIDDIASNYVLEHFDNLQIGIQPWVLSNSGKKIMNNTSFVCSHSHYVRPYLTLIDKIFIGIEKTFKQLIVYNRYGKD